MHATHAHPPPATQYPPDNLLRFNLTLPEASSEIWRRVLVPSDCSLGDLHYVISYSFCWFTDSEHEFSRGSRVFGPDHPMYKPAPRGREDEHEVDLTDLFKHPGDEMHYVYQLRDQWRVHVSYEGEERPEANEKYPRCTHGINDAPPDGIGGIYRYNEAVQAFRNPNTWKALCKKRGPADWQDLFDPTYLDLGVINMSLTLIFPPPTEATTLT